MLLANSDEISLSSLSLVFTLAKASIAVEILQLENNSIKEITRLRSIQAMPYFSYLFWERSFKKSRENVEDIFERTSETLRTWAKREIRSSELTSNSS
jgi:hypothetical protein